MAKKIWRKPEVRSIVAGSAEGPRPPGNKDGASAKS